MKLKLPFAPAMALLLGALPALAGTLTVTNAWSRSTPPGVKVGVAYFTLRNDTGHSDRLLKISSPVAESVQVHRTEILDGIARMREVAVLHVDAGQTVEFAPNGMHVMLMGLKKPLVEGEKFDLDLVFEVSGARRVPVVVRKDQALSAPARAPAPRS
jgi:copper(I)-binding protein